MALVKCKECSNEVATSAKACPKCGNKMPKRTGLLTWIVGGFFILVVFSMVMGSLESGKRDEASQQAATARQRAQAEEEKRITALPPEQRAVREKALAETKAAQALAERQAQGLAWNYRETKDEMAGKPVRTADVMSENQVEFDFPYQGAQRGRLQFRAHPRHGKNAILFVERGQFNCNTQGCSVSVRFDEGAAQAYEMSEPDDNSSTVLFFNNYDRFLAAVRKAKVVRIEAGFYQQGNHVFEFHVDGLEWK